jgi:ATP-dependent helicase/nuclease subunit A
MAAPERLSVSTLLDLTEEKIGERNSREVKSYDQLERSLRLPYAGTKIHSLLERLRYRPDMDIKAYLQKWFHDPSPQLVEGFEYVMDLSLPPMRKLLQQGEVEWGFQTKTARGVLEGQVDLWGIADDTIWVIDYKSGSDFFKERAFRQLELYSYAILRSGLQFPVKLAVIYPLVKKVEIRDGRESSLIAKEFGL